MKILRDDHSIYITSENKLVDGQATAYTSLEDILKEGEELRCQISVPFTYMSVDHGKAHPHVTLASLRDLVQVCNELIIAVESEQVWQQEAEYDAYQREREMMDEVLGKEV